MARRPRSAARSTSATSTPRRPSPASTAPSPAPKRWRSAWSPGAQLAGLQMFFGGYPITPASAILHHLSRLKEYRHHHLPGGGRDRRDLRRDRRQLCRPARRHLVVGPGHRAQGRGDGPGGDDRAAAGDRQFAARRAVDRPADQDRAVGPLPGGLWPQRRRADAGDRRPLAGRRVRMRDRGGADRDPLHDPGDAADRRLYRQCRRAVEGAGHERLRAVPGRVLRRPRRPRATQVLPYERNDELARPWIKPGTPGPRASHRRDREAARHRQHRLFARGPRGDDPTARAPRSPASPNASPTRTSASARDSGKLAVVGWGSTFGPIHQAVRRARDARASTSATSTSATSRRCPKNLGPLLKGFDKMLVPEMNTRPVQDRCCATSSWSMRSRSTRCRGQPFPSPRSKRRSSRHSAACHEATSCDVSFRRSTAGHAA